MPYKKINAKDAKDAKDATMGYFSSEVPLAPLASLALFFTSKCLRKINFALQVPSQNKFCTPSGPLKNKFGLKIGPKQIDNDPFFRNAPLCGLG